VVRDQHFARAIDLDLTDPLRDFRDIFDLPPDIVYLDGNSLGAPPRGVRDRIAGLIQYEWGERLTRGWNEKWMELPRRLGGKIAALIGADADEVIVCDSTSVNFFKLAAAAGRFQNGREGVICEEVGFPTNGYILEAIFKAEHTRRVPCEDGVTMPPESIEALLDSNIGLLALNHVNYRSSWLHDMERLNRAASTCGALNLWDLSHSVGVVPIDLHRAGADLAVGCTYKFLNGGPGAPAFLYVRRDLQQRLGNPIQGWFGQKDFFEFGEAYEPETDIRRFLTGTPAILSMAAAETGINIVLEAGIGRIRAKSVAMSEFLIDVWREKLAPIDVRMNSPLNPLHRGSHVSLGHNRALEVESTLVQRMGVIPDFRKPDSIRFGLSPLYNTFAEVYEGLERMRIVLEEKSYETFSPHPGQIT
jgi:kynureninase